MASDLPRVTCLVSKQARTVPRQLDSKVSFWPRWPWALCNQKEGGEDAGSILGPSCGQSSFRRTMCPACLPVLNSDLCLFPGLPPMMPVLNLLPSSEFPHSPLHPPEVLCCLFCPHPMLLS